MEIPKIHESEYRFCLNMWENGTITSLISKDELDEIQRMIDRIRKGGS